MGSRELLHSSSFHNRGVGRKIYKMLASGYREGRAIAWLNHISRIEALPLVKINRSAKVKIVLVFQ